MAGLRRETPEAAFAELSSVSQHNVKAHELAAAVVDAASGRTIPDERLAEILWREWGTVLPVERAG